MCSMLSLSTPGFPVLPPVPDPILGKFLHFMCRHVNSLMFTLTPDDPHPDATVQVYKRETLCNR